MASQTENAGSEACRRLNRRSKKGVFYQGPVPVIMLLTMHVDTGVHVHVLSTQHTLVLDVVIPYCSI